MAGKLVGTYNLQVPLDTEVAEVPRDMEDLANTITTALNTKLSTATASTTYQGRIQVVVGTTPPASAPEGTVIFLIAP